jgi:hypothetical protein
MRVVPIAAGLLLGSCEGCVECNGRRRAGCRVWVVLPAVLLRRAVICCCVWGQRVVLLLICRC